MSNGRFTPRPHPAGKRTVEAWRPKNSWEAWRWAMVQDVDDYAVDRAGILVPRRQAMRSLVLCAVTVHADLETGEAWVGYREIARLAGCHRSTAMRHTRALEELGLLDIGQQVAASGRQKENRYWVRWGGGMAKGVRGSAAMEREGRNSTRPPWHRDEAEGVPRP